MHSLLAWLTATLVPAATTSGILNPEDLHRRPPGWDENASLTFEPPSTASAVEYPLAKQFISAHPSNYVAGGMKDYKYVIIHTQEGTYEGTISWFQYSGSNVSTHYVMRSWDGEITQMVHHADMGQHIGGYNPYSFGIEHEGYIYQPGWYTWETYLSSARLTRWLCDRFDIPIDRDHIVGHVEVPGATHTDPGPYWRWDMFMAMVNDVVPEGRVEGVVVDRSQACEITAIADTWITSTLEPTADVDDDEKCFLPTGTSLTYLHASAEMISQRRLTMEGGGPCAGVGTLDTAAYVWLPDFSEPCLPETMAASDDVTVLLDGVQTTVTSDGRFTFTGVDPGPHVIEVESHARWIATSVPLDMEVYPGARVVIGLDPAEGPDSGTTTGNESGEGTASGESTTGSAATDDFGSATGGDDEPGGEGPGEREPGQAAGCSCVAGSASSRPGASATLSPASAAAMVPLVLLVRRRRSGARQRK